MNRRQVERITRAGSITAFPMPVPLTGGAQTIAAGPDGNAWVLARGMAAGDPSWVLRVSVSGTVTSFSAGSNAGGSRLGTGPDSIAAGPDGNLWFTEVFTGRIGRLTPSGVLTEFAIPGGDTWPRGIVAGPDGNMWFVESSRYRPAVGRITTSGVVADFPLTNGPSDISPFDIVRGPDGDLWFSQSGGVGHISTSGVIVHVPLPVGAQPRALAAGPDGNIWFTDVGLNAIARLGVSGAIHEFQLPHRASTPTGIAVGTDGRIWFTEANNARIASIGVRVPEALIDRRPLVFIDSSSRPVSVRNTGDAQLNVKSVRLAGIDSANFTKVRDGCTGVSLAPDASCVIELAPTGGGAPGLQSANLEIVDNATGSPQRLSLVAQIPVCALPVMVQGDPNGPPQGDFLDTKSAQVLFDSDGVFEGSSQSGIYTAASPVLAGVSAGYYYRPARRWLPVQGYSAVSPDGSRYAYLSVDLATRNQVHVVDIATGQERLVALPSAAAWNLVAFTAQGIYLNQAYEGAGPGLWLLDPDTGAFKSLFTNRTVSAVDGTSAWIVSRNMADQLSPPAGIGEADNQITRLDLSTGATTPWFYKPGSDVGVTAVVDGGPVISARDAVSTTYWIVPSANNPKQMDLPFTTEVGGDVLGLEGDSQGIWVGTTEGVYLWTERTGGVLVSEVAATPAGTCG